MTYGSQTKACTACAKAKRKCSRLLPACSRCTEKGIRCAYPPDKISQFVLLDDSSRDGLGRNTSNQMCSLNDFPSPAAGSICSSESTYSRHSQVSALDRFPTYWFTYRESWRVAHWPKPDVLVPERLQDCAKRVIVQIHQWLAEWIVRRTNPWMHAEWYRHLFPDCMHDAYSTFASYLHQTPENADFLSALLENRVEKLLSANKYVHAPSLEPSEHVARVQALLVYQTLGLYGKDPRQRDLAESRISLFNCWLTDMLSHCSQAATTLTDRLAEESSAKGFHPGPSAHLWCTWILSESVRRTWLVGFSVIVMYDCLKYGTYHACQGGPMFTTRAGAWEAPTAEAWEELGLSVNFGLMPILQAKELVQSSDPEDVDGFVKFLVGATFD